MSLSLFLASYLIAPAYNNLDQALRHFLNRDSIKGAVVAVHVTTRSGTVLLKHNSDLRLMPASNQKLLTCGYSADVLRWDGRPATRIWHVPDGVVLAADGDPFLSTEQLAAAVGARVRQVAIWLPYRPQYGMGWEIDDLHETYLPRVSPMVVDGGLHELSPELARDHRRRLDADLGSLQDQANQAFGAFVESNTRMPHRDPVYEAAKAIGDTPVIVSTLPEEEPSSVILGRPYQDAIRTCLVESDNRIAEMLLMKAAGAPTIKASAEAMQRFWEAQGVPKRHLRSVDGSGLSRHNLVTAEAMTKVMRLIVQRGFGKRRVLPGPGEGTLRRRLAGLKFQGKTGTLDTVTCITGRFTDTGIVVSVLVNHAIVPIRQVTEAIDEFLIKIATWKASGTTFDSHSRYVAHHAKSSDRAADADWMDRSRTYRLPPLAWLDRRAKSSHAADHRAE